MATGAVERPSARHPPLIPAAIAATAAFAWLALWIGDRSPFARYLDHESAAGAGVVVAPAAFVAGWTLMVLATLVPTTAPLLGSFRHVVRLRARPGWLITRVVAGFLGVWAVFGYAAFVADSMVHSMVDRLPWLAARPQLIAGGVLLTAGLFQFSALKRRCLSQCRSPQSLLFRHWGGPAPAGRQATRIGVAYGLSCLGCCWALMLLMFAFAMGSLAWMAGFAVLMALERNTRHGRRLTRPLGYALVAAGAAVLAFGG